MLARHLPAREVALGHIYHVADDVAHLPVGAARLHVPIRRDVNDAVESAALGARDVGHGIFGAVVHRVDGHLGPPPACAGSIPSLAVTTAPSPAASPPPSAHPRIAGGPTSPRGAQDRLDLRSVG